MGRTRVLPEEDEDEEGKVSRAMCFLTMLSGLHQPPYCSGNTRDTESKTSKDLENEADYALQIQQGETINYSAQFPLTGGADAEDEPVSSAMSTPMASASKTASSAGYPASSAMSMSSAMMSSSMSSAMPSMTMTSVGSASASVSPSAGLNSTVTSATLSGSATGTGSIPEVTANSGNSLIASPLAAMFGAAAAFAYLA